MEPEKIKNRPEFSFESKDIKNLIKNFKNKQNQDHKRVEYGNKSLQTYRYIKRRKIYKKVLG